MARRKDEFVIAADKAVGEHFTISTVPGELHFWCRNCVRGWRYVKPATPAEMTLGSITHLVNHAAKHTYKLAKKAAR